MFVVSTFYFQEMSSTSTDPNNTEEKKQDSSSSAPPQDSPNADDHIPPSNVHDLVIRNGFPAFRLPEKNGGGGPNIDSKEPLPRHSFWADENALEFRNNPLESLWNDSETVFSARTRQDGQAYSAGITYFCPCQMKPRCALEALVLSIFEKHTKGIDRNTFVPEQSGAEWWTLVMDDENNETNKTKDKDGNDGHDDKDEEHDEDADDDDDEVGMHFDADYGLEAQSRGLLLHPRLATVTYLTDYGAPTVVLDLQSPPPSDMEKKCLEGSVRKAWLSHPKIGKHAAFDGRLLHGAPSTFFPPCDRQHIRGGAASPPPAKKAKINKKRIVLLVNVWINHCPLDAEPIEDDLLEQMQTPMEPIPFTWNAKVDLDKVPSMTVVPLKASKNDPAGSEEVVICGRLVTINYGATMQDFQDASRQASLVELSLERDVVALEVGEEVVEPEEEDEEEQDGQDSGK